MLNGISKKEFMVIKNEYFKNDNKINLLWVGRLEFIKNPLLIIKALHHIKSSKPIELLIIGNGKLQKKLKTEIKIFQNTANNNNIKVKMHNKMDREKVLKEFGKADIFINTSSSETFCLSALEALANKFCYLILPKIKTMKYLYNYKNVTFYKKDSFLELAKKINKIISYKEQGKEMISYKNFPTKFTLYKCAKKYEQLYLKAF